jgi:hypothetical protein
MGIHEDIEACTTPEELREVTLKWRAENGMTPTGRVSIPIGGRAILKQAARLLDVYLGPDSGGIVAGDLCDSDTGLPEAVALGEDDVQEFLDRYEVKLVRRK